MLEQASKKTILTHFEIRTTSHPFLQKQCRVFDAGLEMISTTKACQIDLKFRLVLAFIRNSIIHTLYIAGGGAEITLCHEMGWEGKDHCFSTYAYVCAVAATNILLF